LKINSGIYKIINIINGKFYIGSSEHLERRKKEHFRELKSNRHSNKKLQHAYNKYGADSFNFEIIEYVKDIDSLFNIEQKWLDELRPYDRGVGYNIAMYTTSGMRGRKHTAEAKKKMSECRLGEKNYNFGKKMPRDAVEKMRIKISGKNSVWYGRKHTEEELNKMSDGSLNKRPIICIETGEIFDKISDACIDNNLDVSDILKVCNKNRKSSGGYHWAFLEDWGKNPTPEDYIIPNSRHVKIYCIELDIIFDTIEDAARYLDVYPSNISGMLRDKHNAVKGYHFAKYDEWILNPNPEKYIRKDKNKKEIFKVDDGTIYESAADAERKTGICRHNIVSCCRFETNTAGGYRWMFYEDYLENGIKIRKNAHKVRPVICIETNKIYESISLAAKDINLSHCSIGAVLNGRNKTAGGYHWKYAD
jgi:group I intron endonuclease